MFPIDARHGPQRFRQPGMPTEPVHLAPNSMMPSPRTNMYLDYPTSQWDGRDGEPTPTAWLFWKDSERKWKKLNRQIVAQKLPGANPYYYLGRDREALDLVKMVPQYHRSGKFKGLSPDTIYDIFDRRSKSRNQEQRERFYRELDFGFLKNMTILDNFYNPDKESIARPLDAKIAYYALRNMDDQMKYIETEAPMLAPKLVNYIKDEKESALQVILDTFKKYDDVLFEFLVGAFSKYHGNYPTLKYGYEHLPTEWMDKEIVALAAVKVDAVNMTNVPRDIRTQKFYLEAAKLNGLALEYMMRKIGLDAEIVWAALNQNPKAIKFVDPEIDGYRDMAIFAESSVD